MKIAVIGAGGWGTALASMLGQKHSEVVLWNREEDLTPQIIATRENSRYLPGVLLPDSVAVTGDIKAAAQGAGLVIVVTPSHGVRATAAALAGAISKDALVVSATKGLEVTTQKRMTEIIVEEIPYMANNIVAMSGPNHAEEVGRKQPSATVVASASRKNAEAVQDIMMQPYFRVYTNPDIIGVELGGALKNIIALGAGIADGLGFGDNVQAALMTRGLAEIARLGIAMGARPLTFAGLSGVGDLIVTCTSPHSRNRRTGILLAEGKTLKEVEAATSMVAEGIKSTLAAHELMSQHKIEMPITKQIYRVLYEGLHPKDAVVELLSRSRTHELEEVANDTNW